MKKYHYQRLVKTKIRVGAGIVIAGGVGIFAKGCYDGANGN